MDRGREYSEQEFSQFEREIFGPREVVDQMAGDLAPLTDFSMHQIDLLPHFAPPINRITQPHPEMLPPPGTPFREIHQERND